MAVDMVLELDGIKGESIVDKHTDAIDVLAWSWGASNTGSGHMGGGSGTGKVNIQDISLTKYVDKATPTLLQFCSNGKHINKGTLFVRKAGEKPLEYVKVTLEQILVTGVQTGGSGGEDRLTENLTLNFEKVEVVYTMQNKDGSAGAEIPYKWDVGKGVNA